MMSDVVDQVIVQQSKVVTAAAASIKLHKVRKVTREGVTRENDSSSLKLKLVLVGVSAVRIKNEVTQLAPSVESQSKGKLSGLQIECLFAGNQKPVVVTDLDIAQPIKIVVIIDRRTGRWTGTLTRVILIVGLAVLNNVRICIVIDHQFLGLVGVRLLG